MASAPEIYPYILEDGVPRRLIIGPHARLLRYAGIGDFVEIGQVRYQVAERTFDTENGVIRIRFEILTLES